ncbi:hypothetical protein C900_03979 [Fulvivirga imtechensis AK7]|uniref:Uncharacterized protein n=1 Tax=Fulvivirga imtechensis AK7 TaxID=1237149 RepID=L8JS45_9BACT|nr:AAA family ATPase [Fulvivirga imtechensis]ELR70294.1 hypothetical protein C900_03979 [Fulvivirga imtechensis AK7]
MQKEHLTSIRLDNFKRFDALEIENISQFNLILGDNNVGKTSLLEALLFNKNLNVLCENLLTALSYKNFGGPAIRYENIKYFIRDIEENTSNVLFKFDYFAQTSENYQLTIDSSNVSLHCITGLLNEKKDQNVSPSKEFHVAGFNSIPYIPFYKGHDFDLVNLYSNHIQKNRERKEQLISALRTIAPDLDNIEISLPAGKPILVISQKHSNSVLPLAIFGDGALKLFRFFIEIIVFRNTRLMIDEIDTGIHYSRFTEFWGILLQTAIENNVQLFMTTHNKECIQYFDKAIRQLGCESDARAITLVENPKEHDVKAFTYTFDQLNHALEVGNEIRGGY